MKTIYILGDSLVLGKTNQGKFYLREVLPDFKVRIKGKKGGTTEDLLAWLPNLNFNQMDYVLLMFGTNDGAFKSDIVPFYFRQNLGKALSKIPKPILFVTPPYVDETKQWERSNERLFQYCEIIKEFPVTVIDFYEALMQQKNYQELLKGAFDDGLHFEEKGYQLLGKLITETIAKKEG